MKPQQRVDALDSRNLQSKALDGWEHQQRAWAKMQDHLTRRRSLQQDQPSGTTAGGSTSAPTANNFMHSASLYREKKEDMGIIASSVPRTVVNPFNGWQSGLRHTGDRTGTLYVQLGKSCLYSSERDPTLMDDDHRAYTRIVTADSAAHGEGLSESHRHTARELARDTFRESAAAGPKKKQTTTTTTTAVGADGTDKSKSLMSTYGRKEDNEVLSGDLEEADYYREQLEAYAPYVQNRFSHFMLPRAFLEVEGSGLRARRPNTAERNALAADAAPEPVAFYPPPERVCLPASRPTTADGNRNQRQHVARTLAIDEDGETDETYLENDDEEDGGENGEHTMDVDGIPSHPHERRGSRRGPTIELSTRQIFFRAREGELVHGTLRVRNTGSVTVYYTWNEVDLVEERTAEEEARERVGGEDADADGAAAHPPVETIHGMAKLAKTSRNYFYLANPLNGVFLPGEEEIFSFSARAPRPGYFKQSLQLLTVPTVDGGERIVVELVALAEAPGQHAAVVAQPVATAMQVHASQVVAQRVVSEALDNPLPYEEAQLHSEVEVARARREAPAKALERRHAAEREAWGLENTFTFDGLPYNREVYAALDALYENVKAAVEELGGRQSVRPWAGGLLWLLHDIFLLRDGPTRNVVYDGFVVLLRAARVSTDEREPLQALLHRAAEELAQHLEDRQTAHLREELQMTQLLREPEALPAAVVAVVSKKSVRPTSSGGPAAGKGGKGAADKGGATGGPPSAPEVGTWRQNRKDALAALRPAEREALEAELEVLLHVRREALAATREQTADALEEQFRRALSLARLPLVGVVSAYRAEELHLIQTNDEIDVDANTDIVPTRSVKKK